MEAVKGMMELAKFKSDVISWNGRIPEKFVVAVRMGLAKFKSDVISWKWRR